MALKSEKDRAKAQQEKFQAILSNFLKDEDNKYCVDCDAKGPRWASWNLGIFLCIRCAGIHRNLGVHISKVKSVNLDSWTAEQVAMMQEMGNSRARAVYEANIPDGFRRPQTDSALEAFIRAKYEHKKYIAKEWVQPKPAIPKEWVEDDRNDKKRVRSKPATSNISISSAPIPSAKPAADVRVVSSSPPAASKPQSAAVKPKSGNDDLLGLDAEVPQTSVGQGGDLFDLFGGPPTAAAPGSDQQSALGSQQNGSLEASLFESGSSEAQGEKSAKDSIMALYGSASQQQMFGVPGGVYMPQQMYGGVGMNPMIQQQQGMMGQMPGGMMGMQPGMYAGVGQMAPPQLPGNMLGQQGMMGRQGPAPPMYGNMQQPQMGGQYPMQQMQFQQMQQQMATMKLGGPVGGMQQPSSTGSGKWGGSGQTLSTNLWQ